MRLRIVPFIPLALAALLASPAQAQSADGQTLFRQRCQVCHTIEAGKTSPMAPNLRGVVGRKAAATDFAYSPALKASSLVFSPEVLDKFLTAPMAMVPGTRMVVAVPNPADRKALIEYFQSVK